MRRFLNQITLLCLISFLYSFEIHAQTKTKATKSETEKWILEKLQRYTPNEYTLYGQYDTSYGDDYLMKMATAKVRIIISNTNYSFDRGFLIIDEDVQSNSEKSKSRTVIPIYDFNEVSYGERTLCFNNNNNTIVSCKSFAIKDKIYLPFTTVNFDIYKEVDLLSRLNKAFTYLKKFYPKPINNEPF